MDHTVDSLKIKACNPDNTVETSQLVGLFRDSYGDQFPFSSVYDKDYWSRQAGVRFLSVLAMRKFRVVGHLGARPESANPRVVQICFPACAAEIRDEAVECAKEAWSILHAVSSRKNWSAVYFSSFSDLELMQRIGTEALGVRSTAILPGYIPIQNPRCNRSARRSRDGGRSHAVVAQRLLQNPAASPSTPLYIPERHAEISRELLTGIGMVAAAGRINIESSQNAAALPADAPALQSHFFKEWGSAYYVVRPTLLTSFQDSLFEVSRGGESHPFIFVDARDAEDNQRHQRVADQLLVLRHTPESVRY
jgi:hypothetical protein